MFYLVQRMSSRKGTVHPSRGFDGYFELDYMGSSEFEWGAIPKALKSMRRVDSVVESQDVIISGRVHRVYFVGAPGVSNNAKDFEQWASGDDRKPAFFGKEWTHLPEILSGAKASWIDTDAWWAIEDDVAWTLDETVAKMLAQAFNSRPS